MTVLLSPFDPFHVTTDKIRNLGEGKVVFKADFAPGVGLIEFQHPKRHNAFDGKMMAQFRDIVLKLEQEQDKEDNDIVAIIVTGCSGKSFCAGIDLLFAREHMHGSVEAGETINRLMHDTLTRFARLSYITVASMAGATLGGGTEMITAFDYIIMDHSTFIRFVQTRMGLSSPWGGGRRLIHRIGRKQALSILAGAPTITADYGKSVGLIDKIVTTSKNKTEAYDHCLQASLEFVKHFVTDEKTDSRVNPGAVRGMKTIINRSEQDTVDMDFEMGLFRKLVGSSKL